MNAVDVNKMNVEYTVIIQSRKNILDTYEDCVFARFHASCIHKGRTTNGEAERENLCHLVGSDINSPTPKYSK